MFTSIRIWIMMLLVVAAGGLAIPPVSAQDNALPAAPPPIAAYPSDGFNMRVVEQPTPYYVITTLDPPVFNWFAGIFTNLPTDQDVTIGLNMNAMDHPINNADVGKWEGLKPVMTFADPRRYEAYEWYRKDEQGRWVSGDPFKSGEEKYAGNGKTPRQHVMPEAVADQFLSPDGNYWQPWREIEHVEVVATLNIFRIKQRFALPTATIAMRIPYTYTFLQTFLERLRAAKIDGVSIDAIGKTPGRRKLQAIRIEDPASTAAAEDKRTVLIIAREHATEHASSWALHGMVTRLLTAQPETQALRKDTTWIFIPIQDPDGSANSTFDNLTEWMCHAWDPKIPREMFDYARYLADYVNSGRSIDVSMVLHNVEASECPHVFCPFVDARFPEMVVDFNRMLFAALRKDGYVTSPPEENAGKGWMNFRLYGWCALCFGAFDLAYEVNDRYPPQTLSLVKLQGIGGVITEQIGAWQSGDNGRKWHAQALAFLAKRKVEQERHFKEYGIKTPDQRNEADLLVYGY